MTDETIKDEVVLVTPAPKPAKKKASSPRITNAAIKKTVDDFSAGLSENREKVEELGATVQGVKDELNDLCVAVGNMLPILNDIGKRHTDVPAQAAPIQESAAPQAPSDVVTSREQFNAYLKAMNSRDAELSNKNLMLLMERICSMREDFIKLCDGMEGKLGGFSAKDVFESFKAYDVDMENMLVDIGVAIGPYGADGEPIDTRHQRIVEVVPTADPSKNGRVAMRIGPGYEYEGRALIKEKVGVYKTVKQDAGTGQIQQRL